MCRYCEQVESIYVEEYMALVLFGVCHDSGYYLTKEIYLGSITNFNGYKTQEPAWALC